MNAIITTIQLISAILITLLIFSLIGWFLDWVDYQQFRPFIFFNALYNRYNEFSDSKRDMKVLYVGMTFIFTFISLLMIAGFFDLLNKRRRK